MLVQSYERKGQKGTTVRWFQSYLPFFSSLSCFSQPPFLFGLVVCLSISWRVFCSRSCSRPRPRSHRELRTQWGQVQTYRTEYTVSSAKEGGRDGGEAESTQQLMASLSIEKADKIIKRGKNGTCFHTARTVGGSSMGDRSVL